MMRGASVFRLTPPDAPIASFIGIPPTYFNVGGTKVRSNI